MRSMACASLPRQGVPSWQLPVERGYWSDRTAEAETLRKRSDDSQVRTFAGFLGLSNRTGLAPFASASEMRLWRQGWGARSRRKKPLRNQTMLNNIDFVSSHKRPSRFSRIWVEFELRIFP
jgi:hypothetical protein